MSKQKVEIVENLSIVNGGALKRVGALLIDLTIFVGLMFLISLISTPILNKTSNYTTRLTNEARETKRSFLVTLERELTSAELSDDLMLDTIQVLQNSVDFTKYAEATYKFYTIYLASNNTDPNVTYDDDWYIDNILEVSKETSPLKRIEEDDPLGKKRASDGSEVVEELKYDPFLVPGTTYKVSEVDADVINDFYKGIYRQAIKVFQDRPEYIAVSNLVTIDNIIRIVISSSIVFLMFPLFFSYGQTLGKKVLKLGLATTHGYRVSWLQVLLRYFVFLFVNILSNFLIMIVFPFVSLTFMIFNKRAKSLHDLAAGTRVVDLNKSVVYESAEAYLKSQVAPPKMVRDEIINDEVFAERFREDSGA